MDIKGSKDIRCLMFCLLIVKSEANALHSLHFLQSINKTSSIVLPYNSTVIKLSGSSRKNILNSPATTWGSSSLVKDVRSLFSTCAFSFCKPIELAAIRNIPSN